MAKTKKWTIIIDGTPYRVVFNLNQWSGRHTLVINDKPVVLQRAAFQNFIGIDQAIKIGKKDCRFVLNGREADIAVDGVLSHTKGKYVQKLSVPWWLWIFVVACAVIPIISRGGAIPVVIALLGIIYSVRVSVSPTKSTASRISTCLGITVGAWAAFALLIVVLSYMPGY